MTTARRSLRAPNLKVINVARGRVLVELRRYPEALSLFDAALKHYLVKEPLKDETKPKSYKAKKAPFDLWFYSDRRRLPRSLSRRTRRRRYGRGLALLHVGRRVEANDSLIYTRKVAKWNADRARTEHLLFAVIGEGRACGRCVGPGLVRCGRCKAVYYCTKACQQAAWKDHKARCKPNATAPAPPPRVCPPAPPPPPAPAPAPAAAAESDDDADDEADAPAPAPAPAGPPKVGNEAGLAYLRRLADEERRAAAAKAAAPAAPDDAGPPEAVGASDSDSDSDGLEGVH